jgi:hypothetical protein
LPAPGGPEQQQIGRLVEPGVAGSERHHARLAEHRDGGEVEVVERLARRQASLDEISFDAPAAALGELKFGEHGQEPRRRPALAVGALGEVRPEPGDGGQAQIVQQQRQAGGVHLDRAHGCSHSCDVPSNAS